MDCLIEMHGGTKSLFNSAQGWGVVKNGTVFRNSEVKLVKIDKKFGLRFQEILLKVTNIHDAKEYIKKPNPRKLESANINENIIMELEGDGLSNFKIDKGMFLVSGAGDSQLSQWLDQNKKL